MKSILILFPAFLFCLACRAQNPPLTFSVAPDTSNVSFSGMPKLMVTRSGTGKNMKFQMNRKDFSSFLETISFLQKSRDLALEGEAISKGHVIKKDSTISKLQRYHEAELLRTENFQGVYENLKLADQSNRIALKTCIDDFQKLKDQKQKGKSKVFVKGILWGVAIGAVGGIIAGAAL